MAVPLVVGLIYGEDALAFAVSMIIAVAIGAGMERLHDDPDLGPRDALAVVSLAWFAAAVVGAIPYIIAGYGTASALGPDERAVRIDERVHDDGGDRDHRDQLRAALARGVDVASAHAVARRDGDHRADGRDPPAVGGQRRRADEVGGPGPGLQKLTPRIAQTDRAPSGSSTPDSRRPSSRSCSASGSRRSRRR